MELIELKGLSVLFVLFSGLLGCFTAMFIIKRSESFEQYFRSLASGVMISLSTVHLFPDSYNNFNEISTFNWSGVCIMCGIFIIFILENIVHSYHHHDISHIEINHKLKLRSIIMEFGCIFHSVIIGISLGVEQTEIKGLLIGLCCHQFLEGLGVGAIVTSANFSKTKSYLLKTLFSITAPIGIAIGIAIAKSYEEESKTSHFIQGIFNGLSCGLLLYVSFVQLIAEDFINHSMSTKARIISVITFSIGSVSMILIAIYGESHNH